MIKTETPNKDDLNKTNKKLISDLESYLLFVDLYRKDRSARAKKYVDKIVRKESSIVNRINLLKELDNALALPDKGDKYLNKVFAEKDILPHEEKRPS
ncbi:MAG: hypothetical protein OEZ36_03470, partial [Spirochaetota bacterium]|nr:hypothetical protein [Spirochaetota bacterium]